MSCISQQSTDGPLPREGVEEIITAAAERITLGRADELARELVEAVRKQKGVKHVTAAGSLRRGKETVGDIDVLIQARDRKAATQQILDYGQIDEVIARGEETTY